MEIKMRTVGLFFLCRANTQVWYVTADSAEGL